MKVYLVTSWNSHGKHEEKIGVYSSRKKARTKVKELKKRFIWGMAFSYKDFEVK